MTQLIPLAVLVFLLTACVAPASTTNPTSPVVQQFGPLNIVAVGVAILGGFIGLGLVLRNRNQEPEEPEPVEKPKSKKKKNRK